MKGWELFCGSVVFLGIAATAGWAADEASLYGRVSVVAGAGQYRSGAGEWSDALANEPVVTGTGLRTAQGAEAELSTPGARVALAPTSELQVIRFDGESLQIAVSQGRIGVHLDQTGPAKTVEIDLPQGAAWLGAPGDYDIAAGDAQNRASVQVFAGSARLGGGLDDSHFATIAPDWFSDWWRSQADNADLTYRPMPDLAGAAALGDAGRWELDPRLGNVWYPSNVAADWAPYRDGAWRFLAPWGWTWIDSAPWGFAPSHYGRWARIDDRWGWVPGDKPNAADFSPAVVAFLGTAGIGLSRPGDIGATPAVAWFPLAPGETVGDADGDYRNRRFATAVPRPVFAAGQAVASALVDDVPRQRFADAPVILEQLGIAPTGRTPVVTPKKPDAVVAEAKPAPVVPEATRQPFIVALRDAPVHIEPARVMPVRVMPARIASARFVPARAVAVRDTRRKLRVAIVMHGRAMASTSAFHPSHNRQHLAARGGA